ncbi:MAG: hypothetical protein DMG02_18195 [Acidobacteria bacterium]|nr:MAG: hypothetical protein DMG02_18195 [Acidobacteriota bacterium]
MPRRQREAGRAEAGRRENLNPLAAAGGVGDGERSIGRDRKRRGIDDSSFLAADVHDFPRARPRRVHAEDDVRPPIEHEVLSGRRLLKTSWIAETSGDVRRDRIDRTEYVDLQRGEQKNQTAEGAEHAEIPVQ